MHPSNYTRCIYQVNDFCCSFIFTLMGSFLYGILWASSGLWTTLCPPKLEKEEFKLINMSFEWHWPPPLKSMPNLMGRRSHWTQTFICCKYPPLLLEMLQQLHGFFFSKNQRFYSKDFGRKKENPKKQVVQHYRYIHICMWDFSVQIIS